MYVLRKNLIIKSYFVGPGVLDGVDDDVGGLVFENSAVLENNLSLDPTFRVLRRLDVNLKKNQFWFRCRIFLPPEVLVWFNWIGASLLQQQQ